MGSEFSEPDTNEDQETVLFTRDLWSCIVEFSDCQTLFGVLSRISRWHYDFISDGRNHRVIRSVVKHSVPVLMHHCESIAVLDECRVLWNGLVDRVFDELPAIQSEYQRRELILDAAMPIGGDPHSISRWVHRLLNAQIDENHVKYQDSDMYEIDEMSADDYELSEQLSSLLVDMKDTREVIVQSIHQDISELITDFNHDILTVDDVLNQRKDLIHFMFHVLSHPIMFHCDRKVKPLNDPNREFFSEYEENITTLASEIQYFAAQLVAVITADTTEHTQQICQMGCIPALMECLKRSQDTDNTCMCLKSLGYLSDDCEETLEAVRHSECMDYISTNLDRFMDEERRLDAAWVFIHLCKNNDHWSLSREMKKKCLPSILECIYSAKDWEMLSDVLWLYDEMVEQTSVCLLDTPLERKNHDIIREVISDGPRSLWIDPLLGLLSDIVLNGTKKPINMDDDSNNDSINVGLSLNNRDTMDLCFACVSILGNLTSNDIEFNWHSQINDNRLLEMIIHPSSPFISLNLFEIMSLLWNMINNSNPDDDSSKDDTINYKKESTYIQTEICFLLSNVMKSQSHFKHDFFDSSDLISLLIEFINETDNDKDRIKAGWVLGYACEQPLIYEHSKVMVMDHNILHVFYHLLIRSLNQQNNNNNDHYYFNNQILIWMGNVLNALEQGYNQSAFEESKRQCKEDFGWTEEMIQHLMSMNHCWKWMDNIAGIMSALWKNQVKRRIDDFD